MSYNNEGDASVARLKRRLGPVGAGRHTDLNEGPGLPVADLPSSPPVLRARSPVITTTGDSRLIIVNLHVDGVRRLRALLDSRQQTIFFCQSCVSILPTSIQVREGPGEVVDELADGKPHRVVRREVSLPYIFDDFRSDDNLLVIEMNHGFDFIQNMQWLTRYKT